MVPKTLKAWLKRWEERNDVRDAPTYSSVWRGATRAAEEKFKLANKKNCCIKCGEELEYLFPHCHWCGAAQHEMPFDPEDTIREINEGMDKINGNDFAK